MLPLPCVMVTSLIYLVVPTMPCYPASHSRDEIFYCPTLGDALCPPLWYPNFVLVSAREPYGPFRVLGLERCACIQHSSVHGQQFSFRMGKRGMVAAEAGLPCYVERGKRG